jgi:Xaa-Pro aminopeptidase
MFDAKTYAQRRRFLARDLKSGLAVFLGNDDVPMNYAANAYHFRQDSTFLYLFGLDSPGLAAVVDVDEGREILFGDDIDIEDIIWMGFLPSLQERGAAVGVKDTRPSKDLAEVLKEAQAKGRTIHYLPPYRAEHNLKIETLLGLKGEAAKAGISPTLVESVIRRRSVKSAEEVAEMEKAQRTTYKMYETAMRMSLPGIREQDIVGRIDGLAIADGGATAFPTILTMNGQILHNHAHTHKLAKGRLLVVDSGAESPLHYASDITRTIPVGGAFTSRQRDIYEIVLAANEGAIKAVKPGLMYRDIHLQAARTIAAGLKGLGLMKGDPAEAVQAGAHALFFPHGLGHMIGLDVHDMENLGEKNVGYDKSVARSEQFGLAYLRLAKALQPGFVLTVEPGCYFIPALIDKWKAEKKHLDFIAYDKVEKFRAFGGVRIEDNVLVTAAGRRALGQAIPKKAAEVEDAVTR